MIAAASALFSVHGRTDIPIREICERSGASKSSFYARFPSLETLVRFTDERPGGDDIDVFTHRLIDGYARFFDRERRLLQAFRAAERADPELAEHRLRLEREILSRSIRSLCHHYDWLDRDEMETSLDQGIGIIAGAARGIFDFSDQLSIASELTRDELVDQWVALILRYVPEKSATSQEPQHPELLHVR